MQKSNWREEIILNEKLGPMAVLGALSGIGKAVQGAGSVVGGALAGAGSAMKSVQKVGSAISGRNKTASQKEL